MSLSAHSRRALVASAAALAAAPVATAKKKGKKKKPPAPLAFALVSVSAEPAVDPGFFQCDVTGAFFHPASSLQGEVSFLTIIPAEASPNAIRADLVAGVRESVLLALIDAGRDVPVDRIAVTIL